MSFRVQLLSDLHLEIEREGFGNDKESLYHYEFAATAPNLALLGDIGWTRDPRLFTWLEAQLAIFERVFFVAGNHEPYGSTMEESIRLLSNFESTSRPSGSGEFIFLDRKRYDVSPTLTILGCTLWSALNPDDLDILSWSLNDFKQIEGFNPDAYNALHLADKTWLNDAVRLIHQAEPQRHVAVFTHHAPTVDGTSDPKFGKGIDPMKSAFSTELLMTGELGRTCGSPLVTVWAFGHTHWTCDFEKAGVRVVSNQRGYGTGSVGFDAGKVLEL
ncbi:hypothetical protein FRB94_007986 [Tulasnella sp. JGI-2019a]|nr:hypothetical protein FRB94_007986 [Tulasnella sp. JGI-2019a]KAG9027549.1 hypothetical protein FRB95_007616 [Tulasnella sp. JGI-2019a]